MLIVEVETWYQIFLNNLHKKFVPILTLRQLAEPDEFAMAPLQDFAFLPCPSFVQAFSRCHQTSGQDHLTQARHFLSTYFTLCTLGLTLQVSLLVMSIIWLHSVTFTPLVRNITRELELDTKNCLLTPLTPCRVADEQNEKIVGHTRMRNF